MSDAIFRYTVKCDRAANATIERKAKAAGVSAGVFVQEAFDAFLAGGADLTILPAAAIARKPPTPRPPAKPKKSASIDPARAPAWHRDAADRLMAWLRTVAPEGDGCVRFRAREAVAATTLSSRYFGDALKLLVARGDVSVLASAKTGQSSPYVVRLAP